MRNNLNRKEFLRLTGLLASGALLNPQQLFAQFTKHAEFSKAAFGNDFLWGVSTAAYQIEGAFQDDGKSASIWDTFTQKTKHIIDGSTGNVACDFYHRVIDKCLENNIQPWITLYHWNLPQVLQDKGGWKNREVLDRIK